METTVCNLCGADDATEFAVVPDLLLDRPTVHARLVRCNQCGLVYQNPRPTPAEIGEHYPPSYEPYADPRAGRVGQLLRRAYAYGMAKRTRYVTQAVPQGGRLLDLGCATGTFLAAVRAHGGWQVEGVELIDEVAQAARARHNLKIFSGTLEDAAFPDDTFDAITLWDVLEHVHDPVATLTELHRILRPGGAVIIRVPNLGSWDAALFGKYWAGLDAPRHLTVYTRATLRQSLVQAGLRLEHFSTGIGSYVTFVLDVKFWMNAHAVAPQTKAHVSKILLNPASRLASAPLFYIPSALGMGPALVAVARKPRLA